MTIWTTAAIKAEKGKQKLACLTAYDYATGRLLDRAGIPLILVGDSLGMTVLGYETTLPVRMREMLHHTAAVARGVDASLVVADMPFLSYQVSVEQALTNAGLFIKRAGAGAVKIEGGAVRCPVVKALVENGIPVVGHIGLTPQSVRETGGYKVQGREPVQAGQLLEDARALADAGVFALVLECMPAGLAREITKAIPVPTIGIGAGPDCDGQILVLNDMLGFETSVSAKFVKRYANLGEDISRAVGAYQHDVQQGSFPGPEHSY